VASKLHGDDACARFRHGQDQTARLWTYVRDYRAAADDMPRAVWFAYSENRKGEHPKRDLSSFSSILQAHGYAVPIISMKPPGSSKLRTRPMRGAVL
jgi:hypothetical protein